MMETNNTQPEIPCTHDWYEESREDEYIDETSFSGIIIFCKICGRKEFVDQEPVTNAA